MGNVASIVLAAGMGTRMNSGIPKVLHRVCGKELVRYPVDVLREIGADPIVVVVSPTVANGVRDCLGDMATYVVQPSVTGTSDAVRLGLANRGERATHIVVVGADAPLLRASTLAALLEHHLKGCFVITALTAITQDAKDLGRVVRDGGGAVVDIVEASDWVGQLPDSQEVNGGVYCFDVAWLRANIGLVKPSATGERHLPWLVRIAASQGESVGALTVDDADEVLGINNRLQLATVEAIARRRIRERWLLDGITMIDPTSVFIDATVAIGRDTIILPNTMIEGSTRVGSGCTIGPSSVIRDSTIGSDCRVTASVIEGSELEDHVDVGPFSHLRPGVHLETGVHVGNFSELKNSRLGSRSAMGHFGYVGDATIGSDVNLGAGLVTCNYDGKEKHRTLIGPGAFIGSDTMLVAPVRIGDGASTGAGSVVTNDVPSGRTAVGVPARLLDRRSKK